MLSASPRFRRRRRESELTPIAAAGRHPRSYRLLPATAAVMAFVVAASVATSVAALADNSPSPAYRQAVSDAYTLVSHAAPDDVSAAQHATSILRQGTDTTQPEILADLAARPPDFADAALRLQALLGALDQPASTTDPKLAGSRLRDVLAMHRYDALHRPPSAFERLSQWIQDRLQQLLKLLLGGFGPGGIVPAWVIYAIGLLLTAAVAAVVFRSTAGRVAGGFAFEARTGPRAPADYFDDADRMAAKGDRIAAIRALCAGVAATISGERTWEGSPLTVREIFRGAPDPGFLTPLLIPFEAAVYGGRDVDAATYERAALVARPFRRPEGRAA